MNINTITNLDLIILTENATELFKLPKYRDKGFIESFIGLATHRSGFYGVLNLDGTAVPLDKNQTSFNIDEDVTILIEGIVLLNDTPTNIGSGNILYKGYGVLEVSGNVVYDGRASGGGGGANIEQVRSQNTNTAPSSKLFDDSVLFKTSLPPDLPTPFDQGGIPAGTTVAELVARGGNGIIEDWLFPTVLASILTNKSASITHGQSGTLEVGTLISPTFSLGFNRGQIQNGNLTAGPDLVGQPTKYILSGAYLPSPVEVETNNNNTSVVTDIDGITGPLPGAIVFGNNQFSVLVEHEAGTGDYISNKGVVGTNLDANRVAGSISQNAPNILGRRRCFFGEGAPTNSAQVRALSGSGFLNGSNNGTFTSTIGASALTNAFSLPADKTVVIIDLDNLNADVTANYVKTTFNVNDNHPTSPTPTSYDTYILTLGVPYGVPTNHRITIS